MLSILFGVCNTSAQADKTLYHLYMKHVLEEEENLTILQGEVAEILVEGGKVVGLGKHNDLLKDCPIYKEIYQTQIKKGKYERKE